MHTLTDLTQTTPGAPSHVTVGVFDGVHRGHQQIIAQMVRAAHTAGQRAVALTFAPHPAAALGHTPPQLLTTVDERSALLETLGIDLLLVLPFTTEMARMPAETFAAELRQHLHLAALWIGPDFALGHGREGDTTTLQTLGEKHGFTVHIVPPLMWEGTPVSSSRVRAALRAGDPIEAAGCLGRPYRLSGTVVHGDGRGHAIGVPTANLALPERLVPAVGIYACQAHTERLGTHPAVINIGTRPTFVEASGGEIPLVEAHLLDTHSDLYGQTLALDFIAYLRDEWTFPSVETLIAQIEKDIAQARVILSDATAHAAGEPPAWAAGRE